jgi:hypothetical protein
MKTSGKILFATFFISSSFLSLSLTNKTNNDDPRIEKIVRQINRFGEQSMQQKVYLQTDKDIYMPGEIIWIKAYLMDAKLFHADTISKEIYVELLDQNQRVACYLKLSNKKGVSDGNILLNDSLLEGNYQLRAFTDWMRNFDRDFFFFKTISIKNPGYINVVNKSRLNNITKFNSDLRKKENTLKFTFFPEGGNLLIGLASRVAFKAENELGMPQHVTGKLYDNMGNEVGSFESEHDGMGSFMLLPQADKKYKAKITFPNGMVTEYPLPQALGSGMIMSVNPLGKDDIKVRIRQTENSPADSILLVAQSRGQIISISKAKINNNLAQRVLPKKLFPLGVAQFTLFNGKGEPICERVVFINPESGKNICKVELSSKSENDSVIYNIKVTPPNGGGAFGRLSFSVIEDLSNTEIISKENILTNLLLTSDIKGRVNNPSYYFDANNPKASNYLDLVMLTNGWRRFVWKDLLNDKFATINYSRHGGISITGTVFGDNLNHPIPNSTIVLSALNDPNFKMKAITDNKGKFQFLALGSEDDLDVKIETVKAMDGKTGYIALDQTPEPSSITNPYPIFYNENYDKDKVKENTKRDNIEMKKQPKAKSTIDETSQTKSFYTPSFVLKVGNDALNYTDIIEFISGKIPGVSVMNGEIVIRGVKSVNSSNEPLFLLNGSPIDMSSLRSLPVANIDRVDLVHGAEATAFGSRGANGVLAFYSKSGSISKLTSLEVKVSGYQKTREFYTPPYESWTYKPESYGIPKTIFWKPNVILTPNGDATVSFKKKFAAEKFSVTLEGLTDFGEIIYKDARN